MADNNLSKDELKFISESYGINLLEQEVPSAFVVYNKTSFVNDDSGKRFVVKKYGPDFKRDLIKFQLRLNNFVYDQGVPAAHLLENLNGSNLTVKGNDPYSLTSFIGGRYPKKDLDDEVALAFQGLARFNQALKNFKRLEGYQELPRFSLPLTDQFQELLPYLPKTATNKIDEYVLAMIPYVSSSIESVEKDISKINHEKQLIHGNFNLTSMLIDDHKITGIFDYGLIRLDFKGVDVMHTLDLYCFDKETPELRIDDRVNLGKLEEYFAEYKKHDPKIVKQIKDMPLMLAKVGLNSLITTWGWGYKPDSTEKQRSYFEKRYSFFLNRVDIALSLSDMLVESLSRS